MYFLSVIFIYKRFNFCFISGFFPISSWFNTTVTAYWKHLLSFLLTWFIVAFLLNQEDLYMIHHASDLFMTFTMTYINIIEDKTTTFHWFQIILISIFKWTKKYFCNFICFIINHDFYVVTFRMHCKFFIIISMEEIIYLILLIEFSMCQIF